MLCKKCKRKGISTKMNLKKVQETEGIDLSLSGKHSKPKVVFIETYECPVCSHKEDYLKE